MIFVRLVGAAELGGLARSQSADKNLGGGVDDDGKSSPASQPDRAT
jgi:hypothetical protein